MGLGVGRGGAAPDAILAAMSAETDILEQPRLAPEWQDWLAGSVVRGCVDADILAVMCENGFEASYARVAIAVVRSMTERVQQQAPSMLSGYRADPIRLPAVNRLEVEGHSIGIGFTLADPNVALLQNLLSADECAELIALARGRLARSTVVDRASGGDQVSAVRTSAGTYFERGENRVAALLEQRIAALCGLPLENGEPLQILHYQPGNEYQSHHDYFDPVDPGSAELLRWGGQRVATVVVYLNHVAQGGETRFPELSLDVKPLCGGAVYFEYLNGAGELDTRCLHAGTPVIAGEKWIATKWLRQGHYQR